MGHADKLTQIVTKNFNGRISGMPTVSLTAIVRNEESMLEGCLNSVKDVVDEMIIIDTGSTDNTVAIAEKFGAKVWRHPWENDFSKHRNQAISYATCDWILVLDADEKLRSGDRDKIQQAIGMEGIDCVLCTVVNYFNKGTGVALVNSARLFCRNPDIRYEGIVHNYLVGYKTPAAWPIYIDHSGYDLNSERMQAKFLRTSNLLKKRIEQDPNDFYSHHNLCVSYSMNQMFEDAIRSGTKAIELAWKTEGNGGIMLPTTYFLVAAAFLELGHIKMAQQYAIEGSERFNGHLDCNFILAMTYHKLGDIDRFDQASKTYLDTLGKVWSCPQQFGQMQNNTVNEQWRIQLAQGELLLSHGNDDEALRCFNTALSVAPVAYRCHCLIGEILRNKGLIDKAQSHFELALEQNSQDLDALLGLALIHKSQGERSSYETIVKNLIENLKGTVAASPNVLSELGTYSIERNDYDAARIYFEAAVKANPSDTRLRTNLALACKKLQRIDEAISHNCAALEQDDQAIEPMINLANIFFDCGKFEDAVKLYAGAMIIDSGLLDVGLRLALAGLACGEREYCTIAGQYTLRALGQELTGESTMNVENLADTFLLIERCLHDRNLTNLAQVASQIAASVSGNNFGPAKDQPGMEQWRTNV